MTRNLKAFQKIVWNYYRAHKREMPWRDTTDPYSILVSEIMLQQTQVSRVMEKYPSFIATFPTIRALAKAPVAQVLSLWQGLGYNRRALNVKRLAEIVMRNYNGVVPDDPELLLELPGIGQNTANSIAAFAFNKPVVFIETNIRRSFIHHFFPKKRKVSDKEILVFVEKALDRKRAREWYWALMDYGSALGMELKRQNPNRRSKHYAVQSKFEGSNRELRGKILKSLLVQGSETKTAIARRIGTAPQKAKEILDALEREGFVERKRRTYSILEV